MYDRQRIEITNVEDMKDVCNDFELPNFREQLQRKAIREQQYNNDKSLITSDLEMLRNPLHMNMVIVIGTLSIFLSGVLISKLQKK